MKAAPVAGKPISKSWTARSETWIGQSVLVLLVFIIGIVAWQLLVPALHISPFVLPTPLAIGVALEQGLWSGQLVTALWVTMSEIILGFIISAASALALGTLISQVRLLEITIYPYVVAFQTMPKVA